MLRNFSGAPVWALALLFILAIPALAAGAVLLCRPLVRRVKVEDHNDVAGFIFTTIGVVYAVALAFLIFAVWDGYGSAESNASAESSALVAVYRDAQIFPSQFGDRLQQRLRTYTSLVINAEWATMARGQASPRARDALNQVFAAYQNVRPGTGWRDAYSESLRQLNTMASLRTQRILASKSSLPDIFWLLLFLGGAVTAGFSVLFHLENVRLHLLGTFLLTSVIGAALLMILEVNYPFTGSVHVTPDGFQYAQQVFSALGRHR